jgi:hypothetical protein
VPALPWARQRIPLAVHLEHDGFLANGAAMTWPRNQHQQLVLRILEDSQKSFGVVPFDSIAAIWTDGRILDWNRAPFTPKDLRKEVEVVIPSAGERWKEVTSTLRLGLHPQRMLANYCRAVAASAFGELTAREKSIMYRTGVVQKKQGVSWISCTPSCITLKGKDRRHSVQVSTINGTPLESFPFRGIQTGADCR